MSDEHVSNRTLGCNKVCDGSLSCVRIERMLGVLDRVRRQRRLSKSTYNRSLSCETGWFLTFWFAYWYEIILPVVFYDWYEQQLGFWSVQLCHLLVNLLFKRLSLIFTGTISVLYLIFLVTYKTIRLGFHLEFHWFDSSQFFVPGKEVFLFFFLQSYNFLSM